MKHRNIRLLIFCIVILAGLVIYLVGSTLLSMQLVGNIGMELSTAGLIAVVLELILKDELLDEIKRELRSSLKELGIGKKTTSLYSEEFKMARERIDIIAIAFKMGAEIYQYDFKGKITHEYCAIRLLILDPESPIISLRARDEPDRDSERLKAHISASLSKFKELTATMNSGRRPRNFRGTLHIKTHKAIPYFAYSRMDDTCLFTPYFSFGYGSDSPVIRVANKDSILFHRLETHFDTLWEREDSCTIVDI